MIFGLLYDLALHLYALSFLPKIGKYPVGGRLGRGFPQIEKGGRSLVWIHAVSLGETRAVAPLIKKIKSLPNGPLILLTTATKTGHEEGKKTAADYASYLPFDFRYVIKPLVHRIRPDLVITVETDFWYHFQSAAKECGAKLIVVNGKLSKRTFRRYKLFPFIARHLLKPIDHFYMQGALYAGRLEQLGISSSRITVTGNIKLDAPLDDAPVKRTDDYLVITLGSTHAPEERIWIEALKPLWKRLPSMRVYIVPRHPERFNEVAQLLKDYGLLYTRWSEGGTFEMANIILVDAMGVLRRCYELSDIAFVGGSFTPKVGGHNILEPAFYGKPVIFGPYMHSQPDLLDLVRSYHAGLQIMPEDIVPTILAADALQGLGENGLKLLKDSRGALDKTFNGVYPLLEKGGSC